MKQELQHPLCTRARWLTLKLDCKLCIKSKWCKKHCSLWPHFFLFHPGQSQVQSTVHLPSISTLSPLSLSPSLSCTHTANTFSHFSWKKTQGCLLDLVLYQIKLYSTCLPECRAPHGCTVWLKVNVVISLYSSKDRGHSGSLSRLHMATAEFVEL